MKLSIVTTMYYSSPYLEKFYSRISATAAAITNDYEIIFVDDGAPDNSLEIAYNLHTKDPKVKIIELSKNFGHHKAIMTGLQYAKGEYVFLIDSDLEEEPELLQQFWDELHKNANTDVVYGVQIERKGHWLEKLSGSIYFNIFNKMSDQVKMTKNISTIRLMKKNYVNALMEFRETRFYLGPICNLVGFNQKGYFFKKNSKKATTYHFLKKYHLFLDSILSFSSKPLYFIFYVGSCITIISLFYAAYLIIRQLAWGIAIPGWTSLIVLISFFGGISIFFMGIISIYILHVFEELKNRPFTIIKKIYAKNIVSQPNHFITEDN